jgi:hypothetical protein
MIGMRLYTAAFLVFALIAIAQSASAYNIISNQTSPSGDITPHTIVTATLLLQFPAPSSKGTFNSSNNLNFQTDLNQATWEMTVTVDGQSRPQVDKDGHSVYYDGFSLSESYWKNVSMTVVMKGIAPDVSTAGTITILTVQETDKTTNNPMSGTINTFTGSIVPAARVTPTTVPSTTVPTTVPPTFTTIPTTVPTTLVTTVPATEAATSPPGFLPSVPLPQQIRSLPLQTIAIGIVIVILAIIGIIAVIIARRTERYEEKEEEEREEEYEE